MTKKEFKLKCSFHEYGKGKTKRNAIYFDWKNNGFSFMVKCSIDKLNKKELFNVFYDWMYNREELPYYVQYRIAENDENRFKVSLMG